MSVPSVLLSATVVLASPLPAEAVLSSWSSPTGRIAYDDQGKGPLVVCVPGMGDLR